MDRECGVGGKDCGVHMKGLVDGDATESDEKDDDEPSKLTGLFSLGSDACAPKPISGPDMGISTVATKGRRLTS